jgi:fructose-bisphosphate aldolase class II
MLVNAAPMLQAAVKGHYAIPAFNTNNLEWAASILDAAEQAQSPVIIQCTSGAAKWQVSFKLVADMVRELVEAKNITVPVAMHLDHGTYEDVFKCIDAGFTSVMYDGSHEETFELNLQRTAEIVKIAHAFGASVEGEIGHVGLASEGFEDLTDMYTTPEEAKAYIDATGVDALAIAIGSAHGVYKKKPMLNIQRLKEICAAVDTPLVLHGGSGLSDDDFKNTIREGIAKVNIFTDLCLAGDRATTDGNAQGIGYLETRNLKVAYIKEEVKKKMRLFGSENKA